MDEGPGKPKLILIPGEGKPLVEELELDPDSSEYHIQSIEKADANVRYLSWSVGDNHHWTPKQMIGFAYRTSGMIHQKQAMLFCFDKGRPDLMTWMAAGGLTRLEMAMHLDFIRHKLYQDWREGG